MPFLVNLKRRDADSVRAVTQGFPQEIGQQIQERTFNSEPHSQVNRGRGSLVTLGELFTLADTSQTHTRFIESTLYRSGRPEIE